MKRRNQVIAVAVGMALLAALWAWPGVTIAEKTAAHLCGVCACLGVSLGAMLMLCIACLSRAQWGAASHKILQSCALAMPAIAVLTLPLLATRPTLIDLQTLPHKQRLWFAPIPTCVRGVAYLGTWIIASETWRRRSGKVDAFDAPQMRRLSAALLPPLVITLSFASFDWLMSIAAPWQSTAMGVYVFAGALAAATSAAILGAWSVQGTPMQLDAKHVRSFGRLLFTFNFFWAYVAVGQQIIVLMADLPDEVIWYAARTEGGAVLPSAVLVVGHFVVPFTLLLFERIKRSLGALAIIAVVCLGMHALDMHQLIMPSLQPEVRPGFAPLASIFGIALLVGVTASVRWQQLMAADAGSRAGAP